MNASGHSHADDGPAHTHAHTHAGGHTHHDVRGLRSDPRGRRALRIVLVITAVFMVAEFIGGWLSNSLALIADAAHMLTDVGAISLSLFAIWFARRPANAQKSYGYARMEILAALVNGAALIVLSLWIFIEGFHRLKEPADVDSGLMLGVASAGLAANLVAAFVLHRSAGDSLNVRGAYLHVLGDLLGSVGAIVAAVIILTTGWVLADSLISFLVALLVLVSSWKLVRESVDVLLEAVPAHIDLTDVRHALDDIAGVDDVHDLHVWTVTSGFLAMSGHAIVQDLGQHERILDEIHGVMRDRFGIDHVTIQLERRMYNIQPRLEG